jgi:hypothetical protein
VSTPPTRQALIEALTDTRAATESVLAGLEPAGLVAPGVAGDWSVKDVLAHLTAWEVEMLTNLGKARRGAKTGRTRWTQAQTDAQNAAWHSQMKDRPLSQVLDDFRGVRRQSLRQVEGLTDQVLAAVPAWLDQPLGEYIASQTCEHETEHLLELRAWRDRQAGLSSNGHSHD